MLEAGARGYCQADMDPVFLQKAVNRVAEGEVWVGRKVVAQLLQDISPLLHRQHLALTEPNPALELLTPREQQVVRCIAEGASNKEIASQLHLSEKTVKAHLTSIFGKLKVSHRVHLVLLVTGHSRVFDEQPRPSDHHR